MSDRNPAEEFVEQRAYGRVEVQAPLRIRVVSATEATELAEQILAGPTLQEVQDEAILRTLGAAREPLHVLGRFLLERLNRIEATLREIAADPEDAEGGWGEGNTLEMSGSGLAALTTLEPSAEDHLEIRVGLPGGGGPLRAVGRVVTVLPPDGQELPVGRYRIGVGFEALHDEDREILIRAIFRRQRALLRDGSLRRDA